MVILTATIALRSFYYRGSAHEFEWTSDRALAAQYPDEATARADLAGSPMAYDHYVMRARAIPADATPGASPVGEI